MIEIKNNPPKFIRNDEQLAYYHDVFDKLDRAGVALNFQDCYGLGMLAVNLTIVDECSINIAENGMQLTVQGDRNFVKKMNPAIAMQKDAQQLIKFYLKEFKMSPNSRNNTCLKIHNSLDNDGFDDI